MPFLTPFLGEASPTKIDYREVFSGTLGLSIGVIATGGWQWGCSFALGGLILEQGSLKEIHFATI